MYSEVFYSDVVCSADDIPINNDHTFGHPVLSAVPLAELVSVDASAAIAMEGVIGYYDHTDVQVLPPSLSRSPALGVNRDAAGQE